jgi:transposase
MSNKLKVSLLDPWIKQAKESGIITLRNFAMGLENDYEAVKLAFSLEWSNGQVEGQVNRLKTVKRQMYGRANFRLLRIRVVANIGNFTLSPKVTKNHRLCPGFH